MKIRLSFAVSDDNGEDLVERSIIAAVDKAQFISLIDKENFFEYLFKSLEKDIEASYQKIIKKYLSKVNVCIRFR